MTDDRAAAMAKLIRDHGLQITCSDGLSSQVGLAPFCWAIRTVAKIGARGVAPVVYASGASSTPPARPPAPPCRPKCSPNWTQTSPITA